MWICDQERGEGPGGFVTERGVGDQVDLRSVDMTKPNLLPSLLLVSFSRQDLLYFPQCHLLLLRRCQQGCELEQCLQHCALQTAECLGQSMRSMYWYFSMIIMDDDLMKLLCLPL